MLKTQLLSSHFCLWWVLLKMLDVMLSRGILIFIPIHLCSTVERKCSCWFNTYTDKCKSLDGVNVLPGTPEGKITLHKRGQYVNICLWGIFLWRMWLPRVIQVWIPAKSDSLGLAFKHWVNIDVSFCKGISEKECMSQYKHLCVWFNVCFCVKLPVNV